MKGKVETFGFLLTPGFPLVPLASAVDVLALANYVSDTELYSWCTLSTGAETVRSMNGFRSVVDFTIDQAPSLTAAIACCGVDGSKFESSEAINWLGRSYNLGTRIGAVSTGSWLLAKAGLLGNRRCTVHWEDIQAFRETFPNLQVTSEIFEIDGRIFTCSGGSAVIDMFLSFVAVSHGFELASEVSEQLVHGPFRSDQTSQRSALQNRIGINNKTLVAAIEIMENHLEEILSQKEIGYILGVSSRHLERLFRLQLGRTPQLYYRELRLQQARSLLRSTTMKVSEIAFAVGFSTSSYFAKCYFDCFGRKPGDERRRDRQVVVSG